MNGALELRLQDAIRAGDAAQRFVEGMDLAGYAGNVLVRSAVERQIGLAGAALDLAGRLDGTLGVRVPEVHTVVRMRDDLLYGYDRIDNDRVWDVVRHRLPSLGAQLRAMVTTGTGNPDDESAHDSGR